MAPSWLSSNRAWKTARGGCDVHRRTYVHGSRSATIQVPVEQTKTAGRFRAPIGFPGTYLLVSASIWYLVQSRAGTPGTTIVPSTWYSSDCRREATRPPGTTRTYHNALVYTRKLKAGQGGRDGKSRHTREGQAHARMSYLASTRRGTHGAAGPTQFRQPIDPPRRWENVGRRRGPSEQGDESQQRQVSTGDGARGVGKDRLVETKHKR